MITRALCLSMGLLIPSVLLAHDEHHHAASAAAPSTTSAAAPSTTKVVLRDVPLVDATGKRLRLAQDVIGERIAVVNFIYTSCTTVCPVSSATFQQLQQRLAASSLGKEVVLVSITVDPLRDTPQRLREYAGRYEAREGWVWLTGTKPDVDSVLKGFGAYSPRFEDHPLMVLIGDARGGPWTRFFGFPSVDELLARIDATHLARKE